MKSELNFRVKKLTKLSFVVLAIIIVAAILFYIGAGESLNKVLNASQMVSVSSTCGEILQGYEIRQKFTVESETLESLLILGATYERENDDTLLFTVEDETGTAVAHSKLDTIGLENGGKWPIVFAKPIQNAYKKELTLVVESERGTPGNAVTLCYGNVYSSVRGNVDAQIPAEFQTIINDTVLDGTLCLSVISSKELLFGRFYLFGVIGVLFLLAIYYLLSLRRIKNGKPFIGEYVVQVFQKYKFLVKTLVSRDFKTKYKRSILGVFWSFLNPLLTMAVLYLVFSTLFQSDIENYPTYLLSGLVCWNFFSETSSMCLTSITGNASLITKVYVPKYIYPISRSLSSLINFSFALVPLLAVLLITKTAITPAYLLLPVPIICLFLFSLGVGMFLASVMVFFRDMQFLWGVATMLWMYMTPVFYTESIIPAKWLMLYKMNPLYHIIRLFRSLLIQGVSPEPKAYMLCLLATVIPFFIGMAVFKKTQSRFVLYI